MNTEPTGSDYDDRTERQERMREGALLEELSTRHLAYQRAAERLHESLTHALVALQATRPVPQEFRPPAMGVHFRSLREAEALFASAQQALAEYRALYGH